MEMEVENDGKLDITRKRRSSILKTRRTRSPPEEITTTEIGVESSATKTVRRVSFASSNFVKQFVADPEKNTIWDSTYEEDVENTNSTQSSREQVVTFSKFESTGIVEVIRNTNVTNFVEHDMEITRTIIDKENIPIPLYGPTKKISFLEYVKKSSGLVSTKCAKAEEVKFQVNALDETCQNINPLFFNEMNPHNCSTDMEFTCQVPTYTMTKNVQNFEDCDMEFTCQIPTKSVNFEQPVLQLDTSGVSSLSEEPNFPESKVVDDMELTLLSPVKDCVKTNIGCASPADMEFTCKILENKIMCNSDVSGNCKLTEKNNSYCNDPNAKSFKTDDMELTSLSPVKEPFKMIISSASSSDIEFTCNIPEKKICRNVTSTTSRDAKLQSLGTDDMQLTSVLPVTDYAEPLKTNISSASNDMEFTCKIPDNKVMCSNDDVSGICKLTEKDSNPSKGVDLESYPDDMEITSLLPAKESVKSLKTNTSCASSRDMEFTCKVPEDLLTKKITNIAPISTSIEYQPTEKEIYQNNVTGGNPHPDETSGLEFTCRIPEKIFNQNESKLTSPKVLPVTEFLKSEIKSDSSTVTSCLVNNQIKVKNFSPTHNIAVTCTNTTINSDEGNMCSLLNPTRDSDSLESVTKQNAITPSIVDMEFNCKNLHNTMTNSTGVPVITTVTECIKPSTQDPKTQDNTPVTSQTNVLKSNSLCSANLSDLADGMEYHMNLTNITSGVDDTQQLLQMTYSKPNLTSFKKLNDKSNEDVLKDADNGCKLNISNISGFHFGESIENGEKEVTTNSFFCSFENSRHKSLGNKLVHTNDTYVLKNKFNHKEDNCDLKNTCSFIDEDSSIGIMNVDDQADVELYTPEVKSNECRKPKEFKLKEFNFTIKRDPEVPQLLETIRSQNDYITNYLRNFKFRPIQVPERLGTVERISRDSSLSSENTGEKISEQPPSIDEKVRNHEKSCQKTWKVESIDGCSYCFSTLFRTLEFMVELDVQSGQVINIQTVNKLAEKSQPIARYLVKLFQSKLHHELLKLTLGSKYDLLSLLDYVKMTMLRLQSFQLDFMKSNMFAMDEDFLVTYRVFSLSLVWSFKILVDADNLDHFEYDRDVKIEVRTGEINENEIKKLAQDCRKSLEFITDFQQKVQEYVDVKEKRLQRIKES